jgi:hypothetical protein
MTHTARLGVLYVSLSIFGCSSRPAGLPLCPAVRQAQHMLPYQVDLLFMVDNTEQQEQVNLAQSFPKMLEALRSPRLGGPRCTAANRQACPIPDLHVGVVSSDLGAGSYSLPSCEVQGGDGGKLQRTPRRPGCPAPSDPWVSYQDGVTNVPSPNPDLVEQVSEAFQCIAELGAGGCGFEHQLESVKRALEGCGVPDYSCTVNPGFARRGSLLAVFWETDEDDCSAQKGQLFDPSQQGLDDPLGPLTSFRCTELGLKCDEPLREPGIKHNCAPGGDWLYPVQRYVDFFKGVRPPGHVLLSALAGPTNPDRTLEIVREGSNVVQRPACQSINGTAVPGIRIKAVVDAFGAAGHFNQGIDPAGQSVEVSVCSVDYSPALRLLGQAIRERVGRTCLGATLTTAGTVACREGDELATGVRCDEGCLEQADCVVTEPPEDSGAEVPRCPVELFDPAVTSCGATCPCWRIVPSPDCQRDLEGGPYALEVLGPAPASGTRRARCATTSVRWGSSSLAALPRCGQRLSCL